MRASPWSIRLNETQKKMANRIIDNICKDKKFDKSDSFMHILNQFENSLIGNISSDYIETNVRDVLTQLKPKCDYIGYDDDRQIIICRETMYRKKEPKSLEGSPKVILHNCLACIKEKIKEDKKEQDKVLQKESIKKLQQFMKGFIAISETGFKYTAFICLYNADRGQMIFSRGGDSLQCPMLEGELVDIKPTCMEKINEKTQSKPCEYLASLEGIQAIDLSSMDNLKEILPKESFLELRPKEKDKVDEQNRRLGIDVDVTIVDDDKYDCICPKENEDNKSCINPKCEHSNKCDSYSPEEEWIREKLR